MVPMMSCNAFLDKAFRLSLSGPLLRPHRICHLPTVGTANKPSTFQYTCSSPPLKSRCSSLMHMGGKITHGVLACLRLELHRCLQPNFVQLIISKCKSQPHLLVKAAAEHQAPRRKEEAC